MAPPRLGERSAGALLHPTSLPGPYGSGDIGPQARRFADFLAEAGLRWWQLLPVSPAGGAHSPYQTYSTFAADAHLISIEQLQHDGLLTEAEATPRPSLLTGSKAQFEASDCWRSSRLEKAFSRFRDRPQEEFERFCGEHAGWLDDHALYCAISGSLKGKPWTEWDEGLKRRDDAALARASLKLADNISYHKWCQFEFQRQWKELRAYCAEKGIGLIGDLPIFVAHDSVEVWSHPELFFLNDKGMPTVVAGVPPDYFSKTGQLWGNVLYRWDKIKEAGFDWWIRRIAANMERFDVLRLDHFIGFTRYWEIPAGSKTAETGRWIAAPGEEFLLALNRALGDLPLIAEDLGDVNDDVRALRDAFQLPGMKVLQFSFEGDEKNDHRPENTGERSVVYPGTHDNDTTVGWFNSLSTPQRYNVLKALGTDGSEIHWDLIERSFASKAATAVVPVQDFLGFGKEARMNTPGTEEGNWTWRLSDEVPLGTEVARRIKGLAVKHGRVRV